MKRLIALLLALAMCVCLFGCGKDESSSEEGGNGLLGGLLGGKEEEVTVTTLAQELGYGYLSQYSELDVDLSYISTVSSAGGKLYLVGEYYDEETYEGGTRMYGVDLATGTTEQIPMPELNSNDSQNEYIQRLIVCPDGSGYWYVTETYIYPEYDEMDMDMAIPEVLPADVVVEEPVEEEAVEETPIEPRAITEDGEEISAEEVPAEDNAGMSAEYQVELLSSVAVAIPEVAAVEEPAEIYVEPTYYYTARKCDFSGNTLVEIDLTETAAEAEWFYCQTMAETGEGDLLIYGGDTLFCFGADGQRKSDLATGNTMYISSMVATENGTVVVSGWDNELGTPMICRVENGSLSAPLDITGVDETVSLNLFPGSGNTVLGSDGSLLYSVDISTGTATKLLSWLDSDINGNYITGILADGDEKVLVLLEDWMNTDGVRYELGTLTKTPVENIPARTLLSIGGEYLDMQVQNAIIDFNRTNDTYRIVFKDYSVYNTEDDYTLGQKQLDLDVVSGAGPDLISLSGGNIEKYISKGVLADMTALMTEDGGITMDQLITGALKGYTKEDKLYAMPFCFHAYTLYGSRELLGEREGWTMAEMTEAIMGLDEDTKVFQYSTGESFLTDMVYQNLGLFVDYGTATCSFNSDAFKSLLKAASKLPSEYSEPFDEYGNYIYVDEMQSVMNGDVLLSTGYISGSYELEYMYNLYTPENGFVRIGYPTETGSGVLINASNGVAISERCAHKDGAWDFVKSLLDEDFQKSLWNLPILESAFDAMMAEEMEPDYYEDENGDKVYFENYGWLGDTEFEIGQLTQEQVDDFKAYLEAGTPSGSYNSDIMEIISEEAAAYFSGDKTADQVADLIQNRVSIYLGETS